jgi:hypothetical protein
MMSGLGFLAFINLMIQLQPFLFQPWPYSNPSFSKSKLPNSTFKSKPNAKPHSTPPYSNLPLGMHRVSVDGYDSYDPSDQHPKGYRRDRIRITLLGSG